VEQATEAILIMTAELDAPGPQIVFANPAFTQITGYDVEEVIGQTPRILQGPDTEPDLLDHFRENLSQGKSVHSETVNYRKDGTEFHLEWHITPLRSESGAMTHFIAIQRDISERKQA
jgi:PAS domain S-box-containing protein